MKKIFFILAFLSQLGVAEHDIQNQLVQKRSLNQQDLLLLVDFLYNCVRVSHYEITTQILINAISACPLAVNSIIDDAHQRKIMQTLYIKSKELIEKVLPARDESITRWQASIDAIEISPSADLKHIFQEIQNSGVQVLTHFADQKQHQVNKLLKDLTLQNGYTLDTLIALYDQLEDMAQQDESIHQNGYDHINNLLEKIYRFNNKMYALHTGLQPITHISLKLLIQTNNFFKSLYEMSYQQLYQQRPDAIFDPEDILSANTILTKFYDITLV